MKLTIDSDVLVYAFIEPTKKIYKEKYEEFKVLHDKADSTLILYLDDNFTEYCMEKGIETHLSGFDTVVFACAYHENSILITGDRRFFHNVQEHHHEVIAYLLRDMNIDVLKKNE